MRKLTASLLVVLGSITLVSGVLAFRRSDTSRGSIAMAFPLGKWTFSAHPYMGEGYKTRPVVVTSVTTEANTLSVTAIRLNNVSSKPVRAVKVGWSLREETNKSKILRKGETSFITVERALEANSNRVLKVQVVSFMEIQKPLIKKGRLEGSYRLELAVTQVLFDDQSSWQVGQPVALRSTNGERLVNVLYSESAPSFTVTPLVVPFACAKQLCVFDAVPPPGYRCNTSENDEFCTNCSTSCCSTICGQAPSCGCS